MEFESSGLSREEIRKRRRKKERTQAMLLLVAAILVVVLLIGGGVFLVMRLVGGNTSETEKAAVDAVTTESVEASLDENEDDAEEADQDVEEQTGSEEETPEEELSEEEVSEEVVSEETSEEDGAEELSQEEIDAQLTALVEEQIASMTIEQKVAGLFFVTPAQLMGLQSDVKVLGSEFGEKIEDYPVGGIVLDSSNMGEDADFSVFTSNLRLYIPDHTFVGMEDEGGEKSPFVEGGLTENIISPPKEIGESLGTSGAYSAGISLGSELRQYGVNVNFAPNVDVSLKEGSVAQTEGFGVDMNTTAELGKNMIYGLSDQEIFTAVKHFPSYGDVTQDGDSGQVISQRTEEDLKQEYKPYLDAIEAGADFVMVSHVSLPKVRGDNRPASLSTEVITDIIRTEWEYSGIVITDFMNKSCMYQKYTYAEAAAGAIEAGADMILSPKNFEKSYNGILDAVNAGTLTEERIDESLRRIYRVKFSAQFEN